MTARQLQAERSDQRPGEPQPTANGQMPGGTVAQAALQQLIQALAAVLTAPVSQPDWSSAAAGDKPLLDLEALSFCASAG